MKYRAYLSTLHRSCLAEIILTALSLSYVIYRIFHVPLGPDEWGPLHSIQFHTFWRTIVKPDFQDWESQAHFLNLLLCRVFRLLPFSDMICDRFPSLLALVIYLLAIWRLRKMFAHPITRIVVFAALLSNVYILDYFGLSRGYALSQACAMWSLVFLLEIVHHSTKDYSVILSKAHRALWFAVLSVIGNFSLLYFFAAIVGVLLILEFKGFIQHPKENFSYLPDNIYMFAALFVLFMFYMYRVPQMMDSNQLFWGGTNGFISDTLSSLVKCVFYDGGLSYTPHLTSWESLCLYGGITLSTILGILCFKRGFQAPWERASVISLGLAIITCLTLIAHYLVGMKFPLERAALILLPLFILQIGFCSDDKNHSVLIGILLLYITVSVHGVNLTHTCVGKEMADVPSVLKMVEEIHMRTGENIVLCVSDGIKWSFWYYAERMVNTKKEKRFFDYGCFAKFDWFYVYETYCGRDHSEKRTFSGDTTHLFVSDNDAPSWVDGPHELIKSFPLSGWKLYQCHPRRTEYLGELKDGKYNGQGTLTFTNGIKYVGEFKNGVFNGQGVFTRPDGTILRGEWRDKQPYITSGTNVFPDGTTEVGTWNHDGNKSGGTISWKDGQRYQGDWKVNRESAELPDGSGTMTWPDGHKYVGEWKDGLSNGHGTMTSTEGTVYVGEFRNGKPNGQGINTLPDGTKYECEFTDGVPNGVGTITTQQAKKYVGQIRNGMPNGQGTSTSPDGGQFVGEYKDGKRDGQGTLTGKNGTNQRGEWRAGRDYKVSGTWVALDGTKEEGTWNTDGSRSGGTITWKDGRTYKGDWKLVEGSPEMPDGTGAMSWPDGRKYEGEFHDGNMDGEGKMMYPNGKSEQGLWKQGQFVGAE